MKYVSRRPSPAMVVACIALCIAFTGTAFAAGLGKNSVGSKQLKKNAVTSAKIKRSAVTSAKVRNNSLTGTDIRESSLRQVPSARSAETAASATNAQSAGTAQNVGGFRVAKLDYNGATDSPPAQFFSGGGLTLAGSCIGGDTNIIATTAQDDAAIRFGMETLEPVTAAAEGTISAYGEDDDFDAATPFDFALQADFVNAIDVQDSVQGTLTYAAATGEVVTATFMLESNSSFAGRPGVCHVIGTATYG